MFEVGKCYAQYCYGFHKETVYVMKVIDLSEDSISISHVTVDEMGFYSETATWDGGIYDKYYVEIPLSLFEELLSIVGMVGQIDNPDLSRPYVVKFKEICKGQWRDIENE